MSDQLAAYTFLPWLRQGIASKIKQQDNLGVGDGVILRNSVRVSLQVNNDPNFASQDVQLIGAGDVIGINSRAIVRTEPRNRITDFEPNYLACIEFYGEGFLWSYTPATAVEVNSSGGGVNDSQQTKLRPWLYLLVLDETEYKDVKSLEGLLPSIKLRDDLSSEDVFPPVDQSWAWAHVHVSQDVTDNDNNTVAESIEELEALVKQNPDVALSRLVCPRKLNPRTSYHAFVIPAFEVGRLAGLGLANDGQDILAASWGAAQKDYPVYYQWNFSTGERGDFEYLVNLLESRPVDERVGIRDMDMQARSFGVDGMSDGPGDLTVIGLEGALKSPEAVSRPTVWPPIEPAERPQFITDLIKRVNFQDVLLNEPEAGFSHPDPVISPPLYGRWHAKQKRLNIDSDGWVDKLNQDPRNRVAAGVGTRVIQDTQETYMQKAWQQLGDVLRANQKIRQGQLAVAVTHRIYTKYIVALTSVEVLSFMPTLQRRVMGSPTTIAQQVKESRLPQASMSTTFRKIIRPLGIVARKTLPANVANSDLVLTKLNEGEITAAAEKTTPDKLVTIDNVINGLIPSRIPKWLQSLILKKYFRRFFLLILYTFAILFVFNIGVAVLLAPMLPSFLVAPILAVMLVTFIGYRFTERLRNRLLLSERFSEDAITKNSIEQNPSRPNFKITDPGERIPSSLLSTGRADSIEAANFRTALLAMNKRFETPVSQPAEKFKLDLNNASLKLLEAINPVVTIPRRIMSVVSIPKNVKYRRAYETIVPIMAHPVFTDPMYKPMLDISSELLVPNLNLIPDNSVTLLETNSKFIESYMVGLNHEMSSELLWREYLTDQRGSYFRQFWDVSDVINRDESIVAKALEESLFDITPIHTWRRESNLGTHKNRELPTGNENNGSKLVLAVRGHLLENYPTVIIFAQKAMWVEEKDADGVVIKPSRMIRELDESNPDDNIKYPIFKAHVDPDVRFLGFDLTAPIVKGNSTPPDADEGLDNPGWFFCIQERPGEPRFGLDIHDVKPPEPPVAWNQLAWNHLDENPEDIKLINLSTDFAKPITPDTPDSKIKWGSNSADMAYILYQAPVIVALHADDMLN